MGVFRIEDLADPRLADYRHVPEPELLRRGEIFVAEGRLVVRTLLAESAFVTRSLLVTQTALDALRDLVEPRLAELPVYVVSQGTIQQLTGFNIHRGCLAIGERPPVATVDEWLRKSWNAASASQECVEAEPDATSAAAVRLPHPLVVLEQIANADNIGGIFRNAAAFGAAGVVLGPNCCDPLYRKAIRTSMGAVFRVPFLHAGEWPGAIGLLREAGFTVVALTPGEDAMSIEEWLRGVESGSSRIRPAEAARHVGRARPHRFALLVGSEGPGLSADALAAADVRLRIPMASGVDSLNVATAVGIALYRLA